MEVVDGGVGWLPPLQTELDALAAALGQPVSLDSSAGTLLGYSAQTPDVDPVRIAAIPTRKVPREVLAYQRSFGIATATGPVRVPANPDLHMAVRTCRSAATAG